MQAMKQINIILISMLSGIMLFLLVLLVYGINGRNPFARRDGEYWNQPELVLEYEKEASQISGLNLLYTKNSLDIFIKEGDQEKLIIREYAWRELGEGEKTAIREKQGVLTLEGKRRGGVSGFFFFSGKNNGGYVEVYLPKDWKGDLNAETLSGDIWSEVDLSLGNKAVFEASSTSGDIHLSVLEAGKIQASTVSGDIWADAVTGEADFSTTSGGITLFTETGDCDISTISGDIQADHLNGDFRLSSTSGDISVSDAAGSGRVSTTSGEIWLQFAKLTGDLDISSVSGDVNLSWPKDTAVSFEAGTVSGEISTFFDGALSFNKKGNQASGSYGMGSFRKVEVDTTSGDVDIRTE